MAPRSDGTRDFKVAFIGAGSALLGALVGALVSIQITGMQLEADRAQEAREKRAVVYADFLDAANSYQLEAGYTAKGLAGVSEADRRKLPSDAPVLRNYLKARVRYQNAVIQVYVYGSEDAWRAAQQVGQTLPRATGGLEVPKMDVATFTRAYQNFLRIFCAEAPATPRPTCTR
ncbi:hypothetical protein [Kribbella deserti]|uniref:Uncharacterized protein n=1 Tax=Kribbella deserti TaxID=1926257 RepID=A0ABV6QGF5_9ACTN